MSTEVSVVSQRLREHRHSLTRISTHLEELGRELGLPTEGIERMRKGLDQFRVVVAVAGEVNRGKSTFLNAMLGARVFPRKSTTCTAVLTVLHDGHPRYRVRWRGGKVSEGALGTEPHKELESVVSRKNTHAADIEQADVWYPNRFTREGVVLVDTPGVNDPETWREQLTIRTLTAADAAVLLLDATKPLTGTERNFLTEHVLGEWGRRVVFVANKADGLTDGERRAVRERLEKELARYVDRPDIHLVSALEAVKAQDNESGEVDTSQLERSGLPSLLAHLDEMLVQQSVEVFATARRARLRQEAARFREHVDLLLTECHRGADEVLAEIAAAEETLRARQKAFEARMSQHEAGLQQTLDEARSIARTACEASETVLKSQATVDRCLDAYAKSPDHGNEQLQSVIAEAKRAAMSVASEKLSTLFRERWKRAHDDAQALVRTSENVPTVRLTLGHMTPDDEGGTILFGLVAGALVGAMTGGVGWAVMGALGGGLVAGQAVSAWRATAQTKVETQLRAIARDMRAEVERQVVQSAKTSGERIVRSLRKKATEAFSAEQAQLNARRQSALSRHGDLEKRRRDLVAWRSRAATLEDACR